MVATHLAAEQYILDQFGKHIVTDPVDIILKQIENQTHINKTHTHNDQLNNIHTGIV